MSIWDISRHLVVASLQMPFLPGFGVCISGAVCNRCRIGINFGPPGPVGSVLGEYAAKQRLPYLGAATFVFS